MSADVVAAPRATDRADARPDARAETFRALVGATLDAAYRRAAVILGDRFEAEDAVHDAAERAWRRWGSLRDPAQFEAWFARILLNECRDRLRRRRRVALIEVASAEAPELRASENLERVHGADRVERALAGLGADERITVVLRFEADLTVPSIAKLTGVREGTVKSRLHHALRKIRAAIEEDEG
jgi:RNA polymerase sigma-70 factor, ECF subfamily